MSIIKKKNNNNKYIVIVAIVAIAMLATLCVIISLIIPKQNNKESKSGSSQTTSSNNTSETISPEDEIKSLSESNRMKRYIGIFFQNIEEGKYQEAYNTLNDDFKSTYMPNIEDFTKYANKKFKNTMLGVTYDNIERLGNDKTGNMYVIWVTVADTSKGKQETNFVIIEKDYNNYEMSFSVDIEE